MTETNLECRDRAYLFDCANESGKSNNSAFQRILEFKLFYSRKSKRWKFVRGKSIASEPVTSLSDAAAKRVGQAFTRQLRGIHNELTAESAPLPNVPRATC